MVLSSLWTSPAVPGFPNSSGDPARAGGGPDRAPEEQGGSAALVLSAVPSPSSALPQELGMEELLGEVLGCQQTPQRAGPRKVFWIGPTEMGIQH